MLKNSIVTLFLIALCAASPLPTDICKQQTDGTRLAHPTDCSRFVICQQQVIAKVIKCPSVLHFNQRLHECDIESDAGCELTQLPIAGSSTWALSGPSTGPSGTTCVEGGKCVNQVDGTMFADSSSSGYIVCQCECEIAMPCPPSTSFNEILSTCDWAPSTLTPSTPTPATPTPSTPACSTATPSPLTPSTPTPSTPTGPSTGPSGTTCVEGGKCVNQVDGTMFADSSSTGYIVCQCECEVAMPCPPNTSFNEILGTCDWTSSTPTIATPTAATPTSATPTPATPTPSTPTPSTPTTLTPSGPSTGPSGTTCVEGGKCVNQVDGTMFADSSSTGYIVCQCECEVAMPCPPNTSFNEILSTCDWAPSTLTPSTPTPATPTPSTPACSTATPSPLTSSTPTPSTPTGPSTGPSGTTCVEGGKCVNQVDGTMFADSSSTGYIVCQCECEVAMPCPPNTSFNEILGTCDWTSSTPTIATPTAATPTSATPTPATPTPSTPTPSTPTTLTPSGPSTGPSGTTCVEGGKCVNQVDGTMFADSSSTGYIVCQCECEVAMPCPPNTSFNEILGTCDWTSSTPTIATPTAATPTSATPTPATPTPSTPTPSTPTTLTPSGPSTGPSGTTCVEGGKCVNQVDGTMFADSSSTGYIVCQCECEVAMPCPPNTSFNEILGTCDWTSSTPTIATPTAATPTSATPTPATPTPSTPTPATPTTLTPSGPSTGPSGTTCVEGGKCVNQVDGTMFADSSSTGYIVCQCECEVAMPCPPNTSFNEILGTCDWTSSTPTIATPTAATPTSATPTPATPTPSTPTPTTPTPTTPTPTTPTSATPTSATPTPATPTPSTPTPSTPTPSTPTPSTPTPSTTCSNDVTVCQNEESGTLLIVEGECNKFYLCDLGCAVEKLCPDNLIYDSTKQYCDYPQNVNCPWPYTPPSGPSAGPSGIACPSGGRCVGQSEGTFFNSLSSCSNYVVCQCECEVEMECPSGLYFDTNKNICNYASEVSCS